MNDITILIIEDENKISTIMKSYFEKEGYKVFQAFDGEEGLRIFNSENIDLIILDLMLPKISGEEVIKEIRNKSELPVIMVSAKVEEDNRVDGLRLGADDYVTKPFLPGELVARVKAQLRRYNNYNLKTKEGTGNILTYQNVDLNIKSREVLVDGQEIDLTPIEFIILKSLLEKKSEVLESEDLFYKIYPDEYYIKNNTVSVHIRHIREKLGEKNNIITTVWGVGYKIG